MFEGRGIRNLVKMFKLVVLNISIVVMLLRTKGRLARLYRSKIVVLNFVVVMRHIYLVVVAVVVIHTNFTGCYTSLFRMATTMNFRLSLDSPN